jgi:polyferredoxin
MDKMGYEPGLIKYSTQNAVTNGWSYKQMMTRIMRPRVLIYTTILWLLIIGLFTSLWLRNSFRVDVVRDRGVMARLTEGGKVENVYRLQIMNATETTQHYQLAVKGLKDIEIESENMEDAEGIEDKEENSVVLVKPAESRWVIVDLKIPDGSLKPGSHKIQFEIQSLEAKEKIVEKSTFIMPR